jgi:phage tail-like protein
VINVYRSLIKPLRDIDKTKFLERYCTGIQTEAELIEANIEEILTQIDIDLIRADLLQYKLPQVGFTKEYRHITDRLGETDLRRLLGAAILLWKFKGSKRGLPEAVRFLTGAEPTYSDWFHFRYILGEAFIGEDQKGYDPYIIGGQISEYDEQVSNLRVMNDGNLDKQMLVDVCQLERPVGERLEVVVLDFLDNFRFTRDRWTNAWPPAATIVDGEFQLEPSCGETPNITVVSDTSLVDMNYMSLFRVATAGDKMYLDFYVESTSYFYRLELTVTASGPGNVTLKRVSGGPPSTIVNQATTIPLVAGADYKLRVITENVGSDVYITVYLDSNKQFEYKDAGSSVTYGGCTFWNPNVSGNVYIDNVEIWRHPLKWAFLKPNDEVDYSSTFWSD